MNRKNAGLASLIFLQMLPATLVVVAIRPLFVAFHGRAEGAMHAFMSVNMLGALLAAPVLARLAERRPAIASLLLRVLVVIDAVLLAMVALPLGTVVVLTLRTLEGAAHVGAATLLLAEAAARGRAQRDPRVMPMAATAIMVAIAAGSAVGPALVRLGPQVPFFAGAAMLVCVAPLVPRLTSAPRSSFAAAPSAPRQTWVRLRVPIAAAFVGRFTVGCVVVSFALFAHKAYGASDVTVGRWFAALTVPFALGVYPLTRFADRSSRAATLGGGVVGHALALAALGFVPARAITGVMVVAGLTAAAIFGATLAYVADMCEGVGRAPAMARVNAAGCLGMLLGPAAAGSISAIVRHHSNPIAGYRAAFMLASLALLGWLVCSVRWLGARAAEELQSRVAVSDRSLASLGRAARAAAIREVR